MKSEKKPEETLSLKREGLSEAARDLLSRVRASPSPQTVYGLEPDEAEAKAHRVAPSSGVKVKVERVCFKRSSSLALNQ
jgi:hypothetical protein